MFAPLFFHWKVGKVPPFVGLAVKVTEVPALVHIEVEFEVIETNGVRVGFTTTGAVAPAALVQPADEVTVTL
jgi:hypothetical protein